MGKFQQIDPIYFRRLTYGDDGSVEAKENDYGNTILIFTIDCQNIGKSRNLSYTACHEIELYENVDKRESAIAYIKHKYFEKLQIPLCSDDLNIAEVTIFKDFLKESNEILELEYFIPNLKTKLILAQSFIELLEENNLHLHEYQKTYIFLLELNFRLAEDNYDADNEESVNILFYALKKWLNACKDPQNTIFEDEKKDREIEIYKAIFENGKVKKFFVEYKKGKDNNERFRNILERIGTEWLLKSKYDLKNAYKIFRLRKRFKERESNEVEDTNKNGNGNSDTHKKETCALWDRLLKTQISKAQGKANTKQYWKFLCASCLLTLLSLRLLLFHIPVRNNKCKYAKNDKTLSTEPKLKTNWLLHLVVFLIVFAPFLIEWLFNVRFIVQWELRIFYFGFILPTIPIVLYFLLGHQLDWIKIIIPRLAGTIVVGYVLLVVTAEIWEFSLRYYQKEKIVCLIQYIAIITTALLTSLIYLFIEVNNLVKKPWLAFRRALSLFLLGVTESFIIGLILFDLFANGMTNGLMSDLGINADKIVEIRIDGFFGRIYPLPLILYASLALVIGIFVQIIWEDKPITEPL